MLEALLPPVHLVLVPASLDLRVVLVKRVDRPHHLVEVHVHAGHLCLDPRQRSVEDHGDARSVLRIVLVGGTVLLWDGFVAGEHVEDAHPLELVILLREVNHVLVADGGHIGAHARGETGEVGRMHPHGVGKEDPPVVSTGPSAKHLLDLVEAVRTPVGNQAQRLDNDRHVLQLLTACEVHRVMGAPLQGVLDVLAAPPGNCQEGHVSDAEAAVAVDGAVLVVLAGIDGVVLPGVVETTLVVHGDEAIQQLLGGHGRDGLMHEPARQARGGQVLLPGHHPHFLDAVLHARPDVLNPKGTVAEDSGNGALEVVVGHVVVHAVANVDVRLILPRVVDDPGVEVRPREVVDDVGRELKLCALPHQRLYGQLVGAVMVRQLAHDLQVPDLVLECAMRCDAVSLGRVLDAGDHLVLLRPSGPLDRVA
mmetsp:Transcript_34944/g.94693  ORF Transcript_34944/g.94693 Transcript_34944/m.94693 type:complete len:422 (+) Transcript_34944:528-1793(+)